MKSQIKSALRAMLVSFFCHSVLAADNNYSVDQQGAVADALCYQIGGGSVITPALTRRNTQLLNVRAGWNTDLMCGNFDISTTVCNQLNGVTDTYRGLVSPNSETHQVMDLITLLLLFSDIRQ